MEAGSNALDFRLKTLERDSGTQHKSIGDVRSKTAKHDTALAVQANEIKEHEEDIGRLENSVKDFDKSLKAGLKEIKEEVASEMKWVRRGLWAAAATFTLLFATFAGFIVQLVASHG